MRAASLNYVEEAAKRAGKAAQKPSFVWSLTDHVCRCCFGRVLARETFDHRRVYRCSNCGVEAEGRTEAAICTCGIKLKTGIDAGVRCSVSENRSPEWPAEIIASQVMVPQKTAS